MCYSKYIKKEPIVKLGGYGFLIVVTGSMDPAIEEKELIIIKEVDKYELDDIVTYVDVYGNLITHRILQIDEYSFISKGDSNIISDESTDNRNIQGKVIFHSKILGAFVLYYLKFVILIYVFILILIFLKNIGEEESENEEQKEK